MEQENKVEEEPLLTAGKSEERGSLERLSSYQYMGRTGSVIPTTSLAGTEVSVDEIRSAAATATATSSDRHYPPSLHAPLISSPEPDPNEQNIVYQGGYGGDYSGTDEFQRQTLDEVEIRELLIDHVGHRCCWGSRPARTWKIQAVEDCNVYVGTLETFIEERETVTEIEPFLGGNVDGKDKGPELAIWELDLRSEFPVLFTPHKELRSKIPHSDSDSESDLSMEDLLKVLAEKEELLKGKDKAIEMIQEKVLLADAEVANVMLRTRREAANSQKFLYSFAKSLLDVADNLASAASVVENSFSKIDASKDTAGAVPPLKTLLEGVDMTEKQLLEVFKKSGVEKYDPTNEQFDPNRHNAAFQVPDASKPHGTIAIVLKPGYVLHDRVLRPAEVGVTADVANETNQGSES